MEIITLYISCFLYSILFAVSMADVVSRYYMLDPSLDNKLSNNSLMTKHHSESLSECSAMCGELCTCFGFNHQLKKCRIHQSCDPSEMAANEAGWSYFCPEAVFAVDCWELHEMGRNQSGVYQIHPTGTLCHKISVYCDMETSGGGWTVIQKREDGSTNFYRDWADYKKGFGNPFKNYWIGNDVIHTLTTTQQELRVHLQSFENQSVYAMYSVFKIGDESSKYRLTVGGYSGTAGDSLSYHNGRKFSTRDQDNDAWSGVNCAVGRLGAWWYGSCYLSNLNGKYAVYHQRKYPYWKHWRRLLKGTKMMIRPKSKHR